MGTSSISDRLPDNLADDRAAVADHEPRPDATPGESARERKAPGRRATVAGALLLLAALAALVAGVWGVSASLRAEASPARVGEPVGAPGGSLRVDAVTPEHMAAMQGDKFAASGMSMSSMGMDMAPEGQRRFAVDVTLAGDEGTSGLAYSPDKFRLAGEGMEESGPIRDKLGEGVVPEGSAVSGILVFQAPEDAKGLTLSFDGGREVSLDLPPATEGEGHSHDAGGAPADQEDGHDH